MDWPPLPPIAGLVLFLLLHFDVFLLILENVPCFWWVFWSISLYFWKTFVQLSLLVFVYRGMFISTDLHNFRTMLPNLVAVSCFVLPPCEFIVSSVCMLLLAGYLGWNSNLGQANYFHFVRPSRYGFY